MLSRLSRKRYLLAQSPSLRIKFQIGYAFQSRRNLSTSRISSATIADGSIAGPREAKKLLASFFVKSGSDFKLGDLLDRLPQLPADHHLHLNSALFLITPSLANVFESTHNQETIINHIFGLRTLGRRPQSVIAVVDAISKNDLSAPSNESIQGGEGIAVCISDRLGTIEETDDSSDVPLINFMEVDNQTSSSTKTTSYLAPVANTLFINGREHTMIRQDWKPTAQAEWIQDLEPVHLRSININVKDDVVKHGGATSVLRTTLENLTEPAKVKSSMGNIVRELETSSGAIISASAELEEIVPRLLKQRNNSGEEGELRVYALVYPGSHGYTDGDSFRNLIELPEERSTDRKRIQESMLSSLVTNGGRLYRVTSGGAGWGKKAGLLSLEPRVDVRRQSLPEPMMPEFIFGDRGVTMPDSQQLIPTGSVIQFLATFGGRENEEKSVLREAAAEKATHTNDIENWRPDSWFDGARLQSICVGTSSVTDLPETDILDAMREHDNPAETPQLRSDVFFSPNTFGLLSNSPMGIICSSYDEHPNHCGDAVASEPTQLSSSSIIEKSTLKLSVSSFTTLIEPPGTSFTMTFSADSGKESVIENRVPKKQREHPIIRKYHLGSREGVRIRRMKDLMPEVSCPQQEKTFLTGVQDASSTPTIRNIANSKATDRTHDVSNTKEIEDVAATERTADTVRGPREIDLDSDSDPRGEDASQNQTRVQKRPRTFRKIVIIPKVFRRFGGSLSMKGIETVLSNIEAVLISIQTDLENIVSQSTPNSILHPGYITPKGYTGRTRIRVLPTKQLILKVYADDDLSSSRRHLTGRVTIRKEYVSAQLRPTLSSGLAATKRYRRRSLIRKHLSGSDEPRIRRKLIKWYKGMKFGSYLTKVRLLRSRMKKVRIVRASKISPRRFASEAEEQAVLQKESYSRNWLESQRLLGLPLHESEADNLRALQEMSADVVEAKASQEDGSRPSTPDSFSVSLYGGFKDRVATKTAVDGLMEGLEEDEDQKM